MTWALSWTHRARDETTTSLGHRGNIQPQIVEFEWMSYPSTSTGRGSAEHLHGIVLCCVSELRDVSNIEYLFIMQLWKFGRVFFDLNWPGCKKCQRSRANEAFTRSTVDRRTRFVLMGFLALKMFSATTQPLSSVPWRRRWQLETKRELRSKAS